jgi:hypothetical protein
VHRIPPLKPHTPDLHELSGRKITHLANTSQRIRFKQVEVRSNGAPPEASDLPTRRKGKSAPKKQQAGGRDANIVDLITGNVDPRTATFQSRDGGMRNGPGGRVSQISQPQHPPEGSEQAGISEDTSSAPETAIDS